MRLNIGDVAPDFSLPAADGRTYRLSVLRGRPVVLAFYVDDSGPMSVVCTRQMRSYSERWDELERDAIFLAIARPSVDSHRRFAAKYGLKMPLLSDADCAVARRYGVAGPLGITRRSIFVIDRAGFIRWRDVDPTGFGYRTPREVIDRIRELSPNTTREPAPAGDSFRILQRAAWTIEM